MQTTHMQPNPPTSGIHSTKAEDKFLVSSAPPKADLPSDEELDRELAVLLGDEPTPKEGKERDVVDRSDKSLMKAPTFEPSTKIEAGKTSWGGTHFVALPHALLMHESFAKLPGRAIKLLLGILSQYIGSNNGHLTATFPRMKRFGFRSKDSLSKSIQELITLGYIVRTRSQQKRDPTLYAITWYPINKARAGEPYDSGIMPDEEASDLWRYVDSSMAAGVGVYH